MSTKRALVISGYGINADKELALALNMAGAQAELVHLSLLFESPGLLRNAGLICFPGGFSFGDHLGSGKVLSHAIKRRLGAELRAHVRGGGLVLGICNGFQTLVKMGLLPDTEGRMNPEVSLIHNESGRFVDTWVELEVNASNASPWLVGLGEHRIEFPIRHGEGQFIAPDPLIRQRIRDLNLTAFTYLDNPNGSWEGTAGITDSTGRILGLMPHPEAYIHRYQHPKAARLRREEETEPVGLLLFRNAVRAL